VIRFTACACVGRVRAVQCRGERVGAGRFVLPFLQLSFSCFPRTCSCLSRKSIFRILQQICVSCVCVCVCVCGFFFFPKSFDPWIVSFSPTCSLPLPILHHQFLLLSLSLFCWFGCSSISLYLTKASSSRGEYLLQHS